eukprot:9489116-Pyramimonas_sp.AAC.1
MEDMEAGFEVHAYMGDATNEDACQKSKVQVIRASTAVELEQIIVKQLKSVSCPSWVSPPPPLAYFRVFIMMLDSAADNVAVVKAIVRYLSDVPNVAMISQFCLLRQYSLMMGAFYTVMESFELGGEDAFKYVSRLAAIANTWRMPGGGRIIWDTCAECFGEETASLMCSRTPGRAIRTRWGSLGSIEHVVMTGRACLGAVFAAAFGEKA